MKTPDPAATAAAAELDRLTAAFTRAKDRLDEARTPLHEAMLRHLRERNARPGRVADHCPYDRNYIGVLASDAGIPPVKGPKAQGPAPVYDDATEAEALGELDELTAAFRRAERRFDDVREKLHAAITRHYLSQALKPIAISRHTPYDRTHVDRIIKPVRRSRRTGAEEPDAGA